MAEVKIEEEVHVVPAKRKPDRSLEDKDIDKDEGDSPKKQKFETSPVNNSSAAEEKKVGEEDNDEEDDDEDDDNEEEEEEEEEESEDEDEHSNGEAEIDTKGKGVLREDKGKGKLIEESGDSSDDGGSESDGDSDLSDDPLTEVDLDNILPSRTRRRVVQPGVYISNDLRKDNDDDSDDSDA